MRCHDTSTAEVDSERKLRRKAQEGTRTKSLVSLGGSCKIAPIFGHWKTSEQGSLLARRHLFQYGKRMIDIAKLMYRTVHMTAEIAQTTL